jgi:hypothetical protein
MQTTGSRDGTGTGHSRPARAVFRGPSRPGVPSRWGLRPGVPSRAKSQKNAEIKKGRQISRTPDLVPSCPVPVFPGFSARPGFKPCPGVPSRAKIFGCPVPVSRLGQIFFSRPVPVSRLGQIFFSRPVPVSRHSGPVRCPISIPNLATKRHKTFPAPCHRALTKVPLKMEILS